MAFIYIILLLPKMSIIYHWYIIRWRLGAVGNYVVFATVWARVRAPTTLPPRTIRAFVAVGNKARDPEMRLGNA